MIVKKVFMASPPGALTKTFNKDAAYILDGLNEMKMDSVKQIVGTPGVQGGLVSYVVFYEDKGIYTCPRCSHDISNTFSFCPNCGKRLEE